MKNRLDEINQPHVREKYYDSKIAKLVRIYWYEEQGLNLLNKFRYLIIFIMAIAVMLRVEDDLSWMVTVFIIAIPLLAMAGYLYIRYGIKVMEYLTLKFATHFGQYNLKLQERQLEVLERLTEELEKFNKKQDG